MARGHSYSSSNQTVTRKRSSGTNSNFWYSLIGWGVSTLLLWLLRDDSGDTDSQQPSKYTDSNANQIGDPIPVVIGRAMIKNPLVSFYGDYRYEPYTEEYGMHSGVNWVEMLLPVLIDIIVILTTPNTVVTNTGGGQEVTQGNKNAMIMQAVYTAFLMCLLAIFADHLGRTTIQKGFKYYLGWQHIICWTGENLGLKRIWMNVYDSNVEASTEKGVWGGNVAWKKDNPTGIVAHINDENMFGGPDEGGGFVGDVRIYFGTNQQTKDPWMVNQMTLSANIPSDLKGLTPVYPMYLTCVIPTAYIGKQATIPEMWFEVVNYPQQLASQFKYDLQGIYNKKVSFYLSKVYKYLDKQDPTVISYMSSYKSALDSSKSVYENKSAISNSTLKSLDTARDNLAQAKAVGNSDKISKATADYNSAKALYDVANAETTDCFADLKAKLKDMVDNYPVSKRAEFKAVADPLTDLLDKGLWTLGKIGEDVNPAEAIYEILTNSYWGCNYSNIADIDINSLLELGVVCEEEGLGISCLINSVSTANDYINRILDHINGVKFDNPFTGKLSFKLLRNDYNVDDLYEFNVSNCESLHMSRLDWSQVASSVSVSFTHADNKYTEAQTFYYDNANRLITNSYAEKNIDGMYFTTATNARILAKTKLLFLGYPLASVDIRCTRIGQFVTIGDPIVVNWEPYGITKQIFRVTDVDYASLTSNVISITAVEDVFGFSEVDYSFSDAPAWTDPEKIPIDIAYYKFIEYPYELMYNLNTYIKVCVAKPSADVDRWNIWRYYSGSYGKTAVSSSWGMVAQLPYGIDESYSYDEAGFEIKAIGTDTSTLFDSKIVEMAKRPSVYTKTSGMNLMVIDDEIISYSDIVVSPNGSYIIKGVIRGVYDTLPKKHSAYSVAYFLDSVLDVNNNIPIAYEGDFSDEQLEVRTETATDEQKFDLGKLVHYYTKRRSEAPSPMANLKFGADKGLKTDYAYNYPSNTIFGNDILFEFVPRNKFNYSGILTQDDISTVVQTASDIQYYIKCSCNSVEFEMKVDSKETLATTPPTEQDITKLTLPWAYFCDNMNNRLSETNDVTIEIGSYDKIKDLYSYDHYEKHILYHPPRVAGIIADSPTLAIDVQDYADSITQPTLVEIPASSFTPYTTMTFDDCPIILVSTGIDPQSTIISQNGTHCIVGTKAYRIDGYDTSTNKAIIHEYNIDPEYVFRTDFDEVGLGTKDYYRYRGGVWLQYTPY